MNFRPGWIPIMPSPITPRLLFRILWLLACLGGLWAALPRRSWETIKVRFINTPAVDGLGFFGYILFDAADSVGRAWRDNRLDKTDPAPYRAYLQHLAELRPVVEAQPKPRPQKNIIYIQMEAVDGLVIGARMEGRPLMPFLEGLAGENVYFTNAIDNTASGRTTDAEFLVLTSAVPFRRPPIFVSEPLDRIPSLPKVLNEAGYRTAALHGFNGTFWRRAAAHRALGYKEDYYEDHFGAAEKIGWGISDHAVLQEAARLIAASSRPLFLHVILLTNHHPFIYYGESISQPQKSIEASFVQSVGYVDRCLAEFYAELKKSGRLQDCIVAIYSDHDSAITGKLERYLNRVPVRKLSDTVPLVITGLDRPRERVEQIAGLQDLPVIVLEELGLAVPLTFTGHGFGGFGRTVGAMHGAVEAHGDGIESFTLPVPQENLTMLSLHHPEKLLTP
jgi:phosphoglycerol transferase MdoB-like AlkP superfamily enzyme